MSRHKEVIHKPIKVQSIGLENGRKICDLEMFFIVVQGFIQERIENGKKGKKLSSDNKITYESMQGILFELYSKFALEGAFSYGTCGTCENFENAEYSYGLLGMCKGKERHCFESCNEHTKED